MYSSLLEKVWTTVYISTRYNKSTATSSLTERREARTLTVTSWYLQVKVSKNAFMLAVEITYTSSF